MTEMTFDHHAADLQTPRRHWIMFMGMSILLGSLAIFLGFLGVIASLTHERLFDRTNARAPARAT